MLDWAEFNRHHLFREPTWRWERVKKLTERFPTPARCSKRDDEFVQKARNFIQRWKHLEDDEARRELWVKHSGLYYAYDLWLRQQDNRDFDEGCHLQARILSGQSFETIARITGLTEDAIKWYEAMYFNVTDRIEQRDYINRMVLIPAFMRSVPEEPDDDAPRFKNSAVAKPFGDGTIKMFSYFGGPHVAEAMISACKVGARLANAEDIREWYHQTWMDSISRRSSQAAPQFEINKYNVTELFAVHAQIIALERSSDNDEKTKTNLEKHIYAMLDEIPWRTGHDGVRVHTGTALQSHSEGAAELRAADRMAIAAGQTPVRVGKMLTEFPSPRKKGEQPIIVVDKSEE